MDDWATRRSQSLKFTIGDYCYWQYHFEAMVADPPLTVLVERPAAVEAALNGADGGIHVVRAYPAAARLPRIRFEPGRLCYAPAQYERTYVAFKPTFKDYLAKFSSKSRSTLQRKVRKVADQSGGRVDFRAYKTGEEMAAFYDLAIELSKRTYQEKMFHEGFASRAGAKEDCVANGQAGAARGYALFIGGEAAAYVFCTCREGTLVYSILGYDQRHRALSPGDVLLYLMIEALHAEGAFRYLDFGEGEAWYKTFYATDTLSCARLYFFPRTVGHVLAVGLHAGANSVSDFVGATLDRFDLRERLRRMMRRRAAEA